MPACVDWTDSYSLSNGDTGYTVSWNNSLYYIIKRHEVKFYNNPSCKDFMGQREIEDDIFCIDINADYKDCKGNTCYEQKGPKDTDLDYGSGLTVEKLGKHFVVASKTLQYSTYVGKVIDKLTTITYQRHMDWVFEKVDALRYECALPKLLNNRVFTKYNCRSAHSSCMMTPGEAVDKGKLVEISCMPGYFMVQGVNTVIPKIVVSCQDGAWVPSVPQCYKLCPALASSTLDIRCWLGTIEVNCDQPMLPDSIVTYNCKAYNENRGREQTQHVRCNLEGTWSGNLTDCTAQCGISNLDTNDLQPVIFGGSYAKPGNVPWHAALYFKKDDVWETMCGGTLVSTRHILTAAHCVTSACLNCKPPQIEPEEVMVGLGKYYRQWNTTEGITRKIKQIHVHPNYFGQSLNHPHDIAVLVMVSEVAVDRSVMPACVDLSLRYLEELMHNKEKPGYVAGWGNTQECSSYGDVCYSPSDKLKLTQTTVVELDQCFAVTQTSRPAFASRLTLDKFCAGNGSVSVIQQGDSGGGLTFVFGGLHYIYGVVSVKLKLERGDKLFYNFGAFTNVSYHLDWLNTVL